MKRHLSRMPVLNTTSRSVVCMIFPEHFTEVPCGEGGGIYSHSCNIILAKDDSHSRGMLRQGMT
ncbi:hypothetical protein HOY82DRAFT_577170 [Tuber indicum]|nr:hypothetical protein HOY82DRAFT_577170 [Tuber indicum]